MFRVEVRWFALVALLAATPVTAQPVCDVSPTFIDFGKVPVGGAAVDSFYVRNTGTSPPPLFVNVGPEAGPFTFLQGGGSRYISPGDSLVVIVQYAPTSTGPNSWLVNMGNATCLDVFLQGEGGDIQCTVTPNPIVFPVADVGSESTTTFTISNTGGDYFQGSVANAQSGCSDFYKPPGTGTVFYGLDPGESKQFTMNFAPSDSGIYECDLDLGTHCGAVPGVGYGSSAPACDVTDTQLDFVVDADSSLVRDLYLISVGTEHLIGSVSLSGCSADFSILQGSGAYNLAPGDSLLVRIEYDPAAVGLDDCTLSTGLFCSEVALWGVGLANTDSCHVAPAMLDFGPVEVNTFSTLSFRLSNLGPVVLTGTVSESCSAYSITGGGGSYSLSPGERRTVNVRFLPPSTGTHACVIELGSGFCTDVPVTGDGSGSPPGLYEPSLALHVQAAASKNRCLPASQGGEAPDLTPCAQFVVDASVGTAYDVYVVATGLDPEFGFAGAEFGLHYEAPASQGVDVFSWIACGDLEFPSPTWPAPDGGTMVTFDPLGNCQVDEVPGYAGQGVQTVLGVLYLYAYDPDVALLTARNHVPLPHAKVADCSNAEFEVLPPRMGSVGFGTSGCSPCVTDCSLTVDVPGGEGGGAAGQGLALSIVRNPFRGSTSISFQLEAAASARVEVFDVSGRRVAVWIAGQLPAGEHSWQWDGMDESGRNVAAGVYVMRLQAGDRTASAKLVRFQ